MARVFSIIDTDGTLLVDRREAPAQDYANAAPPGAGDINGDGRAEFVAALDSQLVALDCAGELLWQVPTRDESGASGPAFFDFDGNGAAEVVYRGETQLLVVSGTDGTLWYDAPILSMTGFDTPVIADVDGDGEAELLVTADPLTFGQLPPPGGELGPPSVFLLEDPEGRWAGARPIWNQHSFHGTHVADDGTVPAVEARFFGTSQPLRGNAAICL
jgi:hypothetical protein